ncbi:hypothetical protein Dimus_007321, partial [Dionaea muscipula]
MLPGGIVRLPGVVNVGRRLNVTSGRWRMLKTGRLCLGAPEMAVTSEHRVNLDLRSGYSSAAKLRALHSGDKHRKLRIPIALTTTAKI